MSLYFTPPVSYQHRMFRSSRIALERLQGIYNALSRLTSAIEQSIQVASSGGDFEGRLEALELSRSKWEAEVEAEFLKAKAKYQAASNSEARARTQRAFYEKVDDGDDPSAEGEYPPADFLPLPNGERGYPDEVHDLPVVVETARQKALRAKFS